MILDNIHAHSFSFAAGSLICFVVSRTYVCIVCIEKK